MPLRLNGSTSGYSQLDAPAIAGDQTFTLPGTGGTIDRLNRAGNILQVVSTTKTDTWSQSASAATTYAVTGMTCSITPTSATSKVLVTVNLLAGLTITGSVNNTIMIVLKRGSTEIGQGDAASNRFRCAHACSGQPNTSLTLASSFTFLDSPATTSSTTYSIEFRHTSGATQTIYLNRSPDDADTGGYPRGASTITLTEVAA